MRRGAPIAFLVPALGLYALMVLLPVGENLLFSTWQWNGVSPPRFIGGQNYRELLRDAVFYRALAHNVLLALASVAIQVPLALALALAFRGRGRASHLLRALAFSPMILPSAVIAWLFALLYEPLTGPLAILLRRASSGELGYLGDSRLALPLVVVAICWRYVGFHMLLLLAGLQGIAPAQYEAAAMDGAGPWQQFRHVTLPALRPTLALCALLAVLGSLKYFDLVYIMTKGGPNHATELLSTYVFSTGIEAGRFGYASAIAIALLAIALAAGAGLEAWRTRREAA